MDANFMRAAHDWEAGSFADFFRLLYAMKLRTQGTDKLWWRPARKGTFSVRSFYKTLPNLQPNHFPWKSIWRNKVPLKANFFAWTASLGKRLWILTEMPGDCCGLVLYV